MFTAEICLRSLLPLFLQALHPPQSSVNHCCRTAAFSLTHIGGGSLTPDNIPSLFWGGLPEIPPRRWCRVYGGRRKRYEKESIKCRCYGIFDSDIIIRMWKYQMIRSFQSAVNPYNAGRNSQLFGIFRRQFIKRHSQKTLKASPGII